ncbi:MAG: hypothetical protein LQ346_006067 [Caloplaca aetnensis]|nr:MAG: hypothetical protein LQ346_006067 [Caloplaca aetnensis]
MPTATASLGTHTLASTTTYQLVEGNVYFPPSSIVDDSVFTPSDTHTHCPWKGEASYKNIAVEGGKEVKDGAWFYPEPITERAEGLKGLLE